MMPVQQASIADTNASNAIASATVSQSSEGQGSAIQPARSLEEESALSAAEAPDVAGPSRVPRGANASRPANSLISTAVQPFARREQHASSPKVFRSNSVASHTANERSLGAVPRGGTPASVYGQLSVPPLPPSRSRQLVQNRDAIGNQASGAQEEQGQSIGAEVPPQGVAAAVQQLQQQSLHVRQPSQQNLQHLHSLGSKSIASRSLSSKKKSSVQNGVMAGLHVANGLSALPLPAAIMQGGPLALFDHHHQMPAPHGGLVDGHAQNTQGAPAHSHAEGSVAMHDESVNFSHPQAMTGGGGDMLGVPSTMAQPGPAASDSVMDQSNNAPANHMHPLPPHGVPVALLPAGLLLPPGLSNGFQVSHHSQAPGLLPGHAANHGHLGSHVPLAAQSHAARPNVYLPLNLPMPFNIAASMSAVLADPPQVPLPSQGEVSAGYASHAPAPHAGPLYHGQASAVGSQQQPMNPASLPALSFGTLHSLHQLQHGLSHQQGSSFHALAAAAVAAASGPKPMGSNPGSLGLAMHMQPLEQAEHGPVNQAMQAQGSVANAGADNGATTAWGEGGGEDNGEEEGEGGGGGDVGASPVQQAASAVQGNGRAAGIAAGGAGMNPRPGREHVHSQMVGHASQTSGFASGNHMPGLMLGGHVPFQNSNVYAAPSGLLQAAVSLIMQAQSRAVSSQQRHNNHAHGHNHQGSIGTGLPASQSGAPAHPPNGNDAAAQADSGPSAHGSLVSHSAGGASNRGQQQSGPRLQSASNAPALKLRDPRSAISSRSHSSSGQGPGNARRAEGLNSSHRPMDRHSPGRGRSGSVGAGVSMGRPAGMAEASISQAEAQVLDNQGPDPGNADHGEQAVSNGLRQPQGELDPDQDPVHPAASVHATVIAEETLSEMDTDLSSLHGRQASTPLEPQHHLAHHRANNGSQAGVRSSAVAADNVSQRCGASHSASPAPMASNGLPAMMGGPAMGPGSVYVASAQPAPGSQQGVGPHDSSFAMAAASPSTRSGTINGGNGPTTSGTVDMSTLADSQIANASSTSSESSEGGNTGNNNGSRDAQAGYQQSVGQEARSHVVMQGDGAAVSEAVDAPAQPGAQDLGSPAPPDMALVANSAARVIQHMAGPLTPPPADGEPAYPHRAGSPTWHAAYSASNTKGKSGTAGNMSGMRSNRNAFRTPGQQSGSYHSKPCTPAETTQEHVPSEAEPQPQAAERVDEGDDEPQGGQHSEAAHLGQHPAMPALHYPAHSATDAALHNPHLQGLHNVPAAALQMFAQNSIITTASQPQLAHAVSGPPVRGSVAEGVPQDTEIHGAFGALPATAAHAQMEQQEMSQGGPSISGVVPQDTEMHGGFANLQATAAAAKLAAGNGHIHAHAHGHAYGHGRGHALPHMYSPAGLGDLGNLSGTLAMALPGLLSPAAGLAMLSQASGLQTGAASVGQFADYPQQAEQAGSYHGQLHTGNHNPSVVVEAAGVEAGEGQNVGDGVEGGPQQALVNALAHSVAASHTSQDGEAAGNSNMLHQQPYQQGWGMAMGSANGGRHGSRNAHHSYVGRSGNGHPRHSSHHHNHGQNHHHHAEGTADGEAMHPGQHHAGVAMPSCSGMGERYSQDGAADGNVEGNDLQHEQQQEGQEAEKPQSGAAGVGSLQQDHDQYSEGHHAPEGPPQPQLTILVTSQHGMSHRSARGDTASQYENGNQADDELDGPALSHHHSRHNSGARPSWPVDSGITSPVRDGASNAPSRRRGEKRKRSAQAPPEDTEGHTGSVDFSGN